MTTVRLEHGILVAFEGVDGAGKTTQAALLRERLSAAGFDVVSTKEPTGGVWGRKIRESAKSGRMAPEDELDAFVRDREEHVEQVLRPSLDAGQVVIVDRYYFSTAAYQGARGLDSMHILRHHRTFAPQPDLLVVLDVDASLGLARVASRGDAADLFERVDLLSASAEIFRALDEPGLLLLDGQLPVDAVHGEIVRALVAGALFDRMPAWFRFGQQGCSELLEAYERFLSGRGSA